MTCGLGILCYHRIVPDDNVEASWPYLERGTAVREATLRDQLTQIARFADLLGEDEAIDILSGRSRLARPAVWLTFDDGYADVKRALPHADTATVFMTSSTPGRALPADLWYGALLGASRLRGTIDLGPGPFEYDLAHRSGRARLVDGPERRAYLRASATKQRSILRVLAEQLDAPLMVPELYLRALDLPALLRRGWSVGSHGATHAPFDTLEQDGVIREATTSRQALLALGCPVRSLALPDGARGQHVEVLCGLGYDCVLGLGDAPAAPGAVVHSRFLVPDDPLWVGRILRPALADMPAERGHG